MATNYFPMGYKFHPTKEELVGYFLAIKLSGNSLPSCYPQFVERDIYTDHPLNILDSTKEARKDASLTEGYFFTRLTKISSQAKGKNKNRVVGNYGTWEEKAATKDVNDKAGKKIGVYKYYKFKPCSKIINKDLNKNEWCMYEYSNENNKAFVLSHIFMKKEGRNREGDHNGARLLKGVHPNNYITMDHPMYNNQGGSIKKRRVEDPTTSMSAEDEILNTMTDNGIEGELIGDLPEELKNIEQFLLADDLNEDFYINGVGERVPPLGNFDIDAFLDNVEQEDYSRCFGIPAPGMMAYP